MSPVEIKPNTVLRGPFFSEPVRMVMTVPLGTPKACEEKRRVDGVLAPTKGLGL